MTERYQLRGEAAHDDTRIEEVATDIEREVPLRAVPDFQAEQDPKAWAFESYRLAVDTACAGIGRGTRRTWSTRRGSGR